jgi:hypothetical protein
MKTFLGPSILGSLLLSSALAQAAAPADLAGTWTVDQVAAKSNEDATAKTGNSDASFIIGMRAAMNLTLTFDGKNKLTMIADLKKGKPETVSTPYEVVGVKGDVLTVKWTTPGDKKTTVATFKVAGKKLLWVEAGGETPFVKK